ncbi:MAG TPA: M23 family metallopeptidase [Mycobacteriales bacterium]|nr:M23 family metallopeptidase [Mycobacteriales bacterium]
MPSHRSLPRTSRFTLLRRHLRSVLLYGDDHVRNGQSAVTAPLALLAVGGVFAIVLATAQATVAAPIRPAAAATQWPTTEDADVVAAREAAMPGMTATLRDLMVKTPRSTSRASRSEKRTALHRWVRPDIGPLSSPYGYRWGTLHPGDDLAGPWGSPILAATDGCIESAAWDGGYGNRILIRDWDGTETLYGHMAAFVRTSGCVKAGTVIGREGSTGFSTGPHLHFEVHVNGVTIDPLPFMAARGVHF